MAYVIKDCSTCKNCKRDLIWGGNTCVKRGISVVEPQIYIDCKHYEMRVERTRTKHWTVK